MFVASTHNYLLLFTEQGRCFWMQAFEVPEGTRQSKGRAIQNLINIPQDDKVKAFINVKTLLMKSISITTSSSCVPRMVSSKKQH